MHRNPGSATSTAPAPPIDVLRCTFCKHRLCDQQWYDVSKRFAPGKHQYGVRVKCTKCGAINVR